MRFFGLLLITITPASGFVPFSRPLSRSEGACRNLVSSSSSRRRPTLLGVGGTGEVGNGPNWIERSFPVDTDDSLDAKSVIDYDLGISGKNLQTGPLSARMWEAIESKSSILKGASMEVRKGFLLYTMDFTAKEAVRAALKQNGLELQLTDDEQDEGMWADIDTIRLLDEQGSPLSAVTYDSWEEAVDHWRPGQSFDFVARQVPAKMKELSLDELLQALDPDGELREQAKSAGMTMPDEMIKDLREMADENVKRTEDSPRGASSDTEVFAGIPENRGYKVINANDLLVENLNDDGTENEKTLMHVMDAMVNHGCVIVDVTDGGASFEKAIKLSGMWNTAHSFFGDMSLEERLEKIPGMTGLDEVGSPHAKVGFGNYNGGNMQFLETRLDRQGKLFPKEAESFLGPNGCDLLTEVFEVVSDVGKNIVRIVIGASTRESGRLDGAEATKAALLAAEEIMDDGKSLASDVEHNEGRVSMSPHRLCLYSNGSPSQGEGQDTKEIFGAHTDSTFVTAVPVASIAGLEVFDEDKEEWYRPEIAARRHWQTQQAAAGMNPDDLTEVVDGVEIPWHARYIVFMSGELLQLCSRNEVMAAVHRVVATQERPARISAPILLRARPGIRMNVERYVGGTNDDDFVLRDCDGMTMEEIHDAMQPSSFG